MPTGTLRATARGVLYDAVLGRVDGLEGYHDIRFHPGAEQLPGLVLYWFDAPLFFANAKTFRDEVLRLSWTDPAPIWIVIAAEPVTDSESPPCMTRRGIRG